MYVRYFENGQTSNVTVLLVLDVYAIHRTQFVHTYGRFFRIFERSSLYATQHSYTMCRLRFLPEQLCGIYRQNGVETRAVATRTKPQETWRGQCCCNAMHPVYAQNKISLRRCKYVQFFLSLMKTQFLKYVIRLLNKSKSFYKQQVEQNKSCYVFEVCRSQTRGILEM